jgi:hypothetical protein
VQLKADFSGNWKMLPALQRFIVALVLLSILFTSCVTPTPALMATNAVAALAADPQKGKPFVQALWDLDIATGKYRYYDGLLTMLALLQVSGNFQIYTPGSLP